MRNRASVRVTAGNFTPWRGLWSIRPCSTAPPSTLERVWAVRRTVAGADPPLLNARTHSCTAVVVTSHRRRSRRRERGAPAGWSDPGQRSQADRPWRSDRATSAPRRRTEADLRLGRAGGAAGPPRCRRVSPAPRCAWRTQGALRARIVAPANLIGVATAATARWQAFGPHLGHRIWRTSAWTARGQIGGSGPLPRRISPFTQGCCSWAGDTRIRTESSWAGCAGYLRIGDPAWAVRLE